MLCMSCCQQISSSLSLCYAVVMPLVISLAQKFCSAAFPVKECGILRKKGNSKCLIGCSIDA